MSELGKRTNNEDSLGFIEGKLYVVCDGVGGAEKGEVASEIVVNTLLETEKNGGLFSARQGIKLAEERMSQYISDSPEFLGMATTATILHVRAGGILVAWVGDSRIYQFREGKIVFKSRDHSWVNEALDAGILTPEEAINHPKSNIITRAVQGTHKPVVVEEKFITDIRKNDHFLLCTDGVLESWNDSDFEALFNENLPTEQLCDKIRIECISTSKDNHTAIILKIEDVEIPAIPEQLPDDPDEVASLDIITSNNEPQKHGIVDSVLSNKDRLQDISNKVAGFVRSKLGFGEKFLFLILLLPGLNIHAQCLSGDCKDGYGIKEYQDGSKFEGIFEKGFKKKGKYLYPSGDVYEGEFLKNLRHGEGVYTHKNGQIFEGVYKDDAKEYGRLKYANGDEYTGEFASNLPDGFGIMRLADGKMIEGMWGEGKPTWNVETDSIRVTILPDKGFDFDTTVNGSKSIMPRLYAVVVGVSDYQGESGDLNFADDDARIFYNHLKKSFPRELASGEAHLLTDTRATRASVLSALRSAFAKSTENDYIIFFFSGHGADGCFIPSDYTSGVLMHREIKEIFKSSKAKYRLCIADACYSGSVGSYNNSTSSYQSVQQLRDARLAVILSSSPEEPSAEFGWLKQGLFSYWLMNGLKGAADLNRDKYITAGELFVYTRKAVAEKSGGRQIPVVIGQHLDRIPLCRLR